MIMKYSSEENLIEIDNDVRKYKAILKNLISGIIFSCFSIPICVLLAEPFMGYKNKGIVVIMLIIMILDVMYICLEVIYYYRRIRDRMWDEEKYIRDKHLYSIDERLDLRKKNKETLQYFIYTIGILVVIILLLLSLVVYEVMLIFD